ncbi:uncharacterized protein LOC132943085 isoform X1 [Metopolophium dirhodum]|uniref:uncharacterized protein LOC132943085 isoform X1 n=1 Tax=Metopolophium dirhodum TaxID=44670 RepID=UPI00298FCB10|nr:uncharacterized protein LOC132943085 isoform X1 [Metopolophium dirhodum]
MPSLSSTDDEVKKSNEKKLTISKDPGWSPLKRSVVESSYAHITSTPVNQTTNQLISDIKSLNSKSKYYHNDNGNSVPLKDDVIVQTNHSILENKQKTPPKPNKLKNSSEDQFKELILYNLLVLKHSIRNINEKLTLVVERQISHNYNVEESNDLTLEYSNLDCLLPIDEEDTLDNIEEQIRSTMHH